MKQAVKLKTTAMAPPTPKECPAPACPYTTPAGLTTYDLLYRDLELHARYAHPDVAAGPGRDRAAPSVDRPRPDKLPRPEINEGATEADWVYFSDSWNRYKRAYSLAGRAARPS